MDKGIGREFTDSGPNKAIAVLIDNADWSNDGKTGKAIRFKGPKGAVELKNADITNRFKSGKAFTVQLWIKPDSVQSKRLSIFSTYVFDIDLRKDTILAYFKNNDNKYTALRGKTKIKAGKWSSVTITYSGTFKGKSIMKLYVDGQECGTKTSVPMKANFKVRGPYLGFTPNGGGYYFNGIIDEVKIYKKALTAQEIGN
jgi:concanavalin A-like lectin/glucanase superfamily protein